MVRSHRLFRLPILTASTAVLALLGGLLVSRSLHAQESDGWVSLFDGVSLDGWKASENKDAFSVRDGMIVVDGKRSHLFYVGDVGGADFVNFEWQAEVKTKAGSNSGMYFHTEYQEEGWPGKGYEAQVNNTHTDPKKTGGLYGIVDVFEAPAEDDVWFTQKITVLGKRIVIEVDGDIVVDYTEPEGLVRPERQLSRGTVALQGHDPGSVVYYRNLKIRLLPD